MIGACYLLIANRAALSGAGSAFFIQVIPWAVLAMFLVGVGIGLYYRAVDAERTVDRPRSCSRIPAPRAWPACGRRHDRTIDRNRR